MDRLRMNCKIMILKKTKTTHCRSIHHCYLFFERSVATATVVLYCISCFRFCVLVVLRGRPTDQCRPPYFVFFYCQ